MFDSFWKQLKDESQSRLLILNRLPKYLELPMIESAKSLGIPCSLYSFGSIEEFKVWSANQDQVSHVIVSNGEDLKVNIFQDELGYRRVERVWEPGEYSVFGDVVVIWPDGFLDPVRISLFGTEVESIKVVNSKTRRTVSKKVQVIIPTMLRSKEAKYEFLSTSEGEGEIGDGGALVLINILGAGHMPPTDIPQIDLSIEPFTTDVKTIGDRAEVAGKLHRYAEEGYNLVGIDVEQKYKTRIETDFPESDISFMETDSDYPLRKGFVDRVSKVVYITEFDLYGQLDLGDAEALIGNDLLDISVVTQEQRIERDKLFKRVEPGDYIVHEDHGVGVLKGIMENEVGKYFEIDYLGNDRLLIPLSQAKKLSRYVNSAGKPKVTKLNGGGWSRTKKKAESDVLQLAHDLLNIYAQRALDEQNKQLAKNIDRAVYYDFVDTFEYTDTDDQILATKDIIDDLKSGRPMDRLLVGDVGFGKTEIAIRAMYAVVSAKYQVAFLAPTTILVEQHLAVLRKRFAGTGVRIEGLSRFISTSDKRDVLKRLNSGDIDILIGTHSILSESITFNNLGLIVIDEEQKFGVKQKEVLKKHRISTHVLSMSATPIPRSLNMSMSGIKDISLIATPPHGRLPIQNHFAQFDWDVVADALRLEFERGGQAYFLNNRVSNISFYLDRLRDLFPDKRIDVAHGQMGTEGDLAKQMRLFAEGDIDVLVCTTIIENGIDLANVNTLIVNDANSFGLSQLYQIRGRVGRSDRQGYAYFLYKNLRGDARARLDALKDAEKLGSGFDVATRDLEIRGAGELIGKEQSGAISKIGYGMYMQMLNQKISELRGKYTSRV